MKKQYWLFLFIFFLLADITGIYYGISWLHQVSKPLLMPLLLVYFISNVKTIDKFAKSIIAALAFSWLGDVFLMFDFRNSLFFILGLSAFLIAHIFYILFFHFIRVKEALKPNAILLIPVVVYYAILISLLSPYLGNMKLPVRIYGVIICFMLMLALHMISLQEKKTGWLMAAGAFLFVVSDSVLAINKFHHSITAAGVIIMLTYGIAQLLIIKGAIKYLRN